jgi:hypothetical protein
VHFFHDAFIWKLCQPAVAASLARAPVEVRAAVGQPA